MRRVLTPLSILLAACMAVLLAPTSASAVHPTWDITLTPANPVPGSAFSFSGHCSKPDSALKPVHVYVLELTNTNVISEVDPVADANGDFSGSFPANWTSLPGWFQVVASCGLQSVTEGYQASPVISATMGLTPKGMAVSAVPADQGALTLDISGAGCTGGTVRYVVLDGALNSLLSGNITPDANGDWMLHKGDFPDLPPADSTRIAYATCTGGEQVKALYTTTNGSQPPVTTPTTPTTATTATTAKSTATTLAPPKRTPTPAASGASAVAATPAFTG